MCWMMCAQFVVMVIECNANASAIPDVVAVEFCGAAQQPL